MTITIVHPDITGADPADAVSRAWAARLAACHAEAFPGDSWSAADLAEMAATPGTTIAAAIMEEEVVVGVAMVRVVAEDAELLTIGVSPARMRAGVGAALLEDVVGIAWRGGATAMFLEVAEDNLAASALYRARGFAPIGKRIGYYRRVDGRVNALVMRRDRPE